MFIKELSKRKQNMEENRENQGRVPLPPSAGATPRSCFEGIFCLWFPPEKGLHRFRPIPPWAMWDVDQVAALCYSHYEARLPKQGKPGRGTREWTELAAVLRTERAEGGGALSGEALGRDSSGRPGTAGRVPGLRGPALSPSRDLPFSP